MSSSITISDIDDLTLAKLRGQAAQRSQSMESYVRDLLKSSVEKHSDIVSNLRRSRAMTPPVAQTDSTSVIRQLRDE